MLKLKNPQKPENEPIEVQASADTGAVFLIIPKHIRLQLDLLIDPWDRLQSQRENLFLAKARGARSNTGQGQKLPRPTG